MPDLFYTWALWFLICQTPTCRLHGSADLTSGWQKITGPLVLSR